MSLHSVHIRMLWTKQLILFIMHVNSNILLLFNVLVNLEPTVIPASFPDNQRLNVQSAIDELQYASVSNHGMYVAMLIINRLI